MQDRVIPKENWGPDHWETYAYVATQIVEAKGKLNPNKLRTDGDLHPLEHSARHRNYQGFKKYPTILKEGVLRYGHDDWSCLDDFEREGFMERLPPQGKEKLPRYKFTDKGWSLWFQLEKLIAEDLGWALNFEPDWTLRFP